MRTIAPGRTTMRAIFISGSIAFLALLSPVRAWSAATVEPFKDNFRYQVQYVAPDNDLRLMFVMQLAIRLQNRGFHALSLKPHPSQRALALSMMDAIFSTDQFQ